MSNCIFRAGPARAVAQADTEASQPPRVAAAQPRTRRAASEQGTAAFPGRPGPPEQGGIELPEQTYSQMLERTVGALGLSMTRLDI